MLLFDIFFRGFLIKLNKEVKKEIQYLYIMYLLKMKNDEKRKAVLLLYA